MIHYRSTLAALAFAALATAAPAHEIAAPGLEIIHPWIALPAGTAPTAAGYLSITNTGNEPERFIGVEAGFAGMAMLHESLVDANGISTMVHLDSVEIAPGETVAFAPGGKHVMFMGLKAPLTADTMEPATLVFEHAGRVAVEFSVEAERAGMATMDHEHMNHMAPAKP